MAIAIAPFDALCVQCSDRRTFVMFALASDSHNCRFYEMLDMTIVSPLAEKLIDRLPFRKIFGKHPPLIKK